MVFPITAIPRDRGDPGDDLPFSKFMISAIDNPFLKV
jgi:hypothetical protein